VLIDDDSEIKRIYGTGKYEHTCYETEILKSNNNNNKRRSLFYYLNFINMSISIGLEVEV